ncbi:MAG: hypothetical protein HYT21_03075 [Candidatus Nealsonbacteria bacterium]|nr:hypothetical protein [Candidatus Nealsonbacteria bacterium]
MAPEEIKPNQIYTTSEARDFLKISESTIKRMLPEVEDGVYGVYKKFKDRAKNTLKQW